MTDEDKSHLENDESDQFDGEVQGSVLEDTDPLAGSSEEDSRENSDQGVDTEPSAAEHFADLQRITAEYANYRKRTEDNRERERERMVGEVLKGLLPVLDDCDRAEKHGDLLDGPFVAIVQKLRASVERFGLVSFAAVGDAFDPQIHEAIFQQPQEGVEAETIADVVETGYYLGNSLLRAAKVVVAVPHG